VAVVLAEEYHCPSCGGWFSDADFNHDEGWCKVCARPETPKCRRCGGSTDGHRTTCTGCRNEAWLVKYEDEIELLVTTKGYSVSYAKTVIVDMVRPICVSCHRPIKGGTPGESLFCTHDSCRGLYFKYRRLLKRGYSPELAIREVTCNGNERH
jgi:hypothetical protein